MRIVGWILQTLLQRSWLVVAGVVLGGLISYWMPQKPSEDVVIPEAAKRFQEIHRPVSEFLGDIPLSSFLMLSRVKLGFVK